VVLRNKRHAFPLTHLPMNSKKYPGLQTNETNCQINIRNTGAHTNHTQTQTTGPHGDGPKAVLKSQSRCSGPNSRLVASQMSIDLLFSRIRASGSPHHPISSNYHHCVFLRITFFDPDLLLLCKFNFEGFVNFIIHRISPSFFSHSGGYTS